MLTLSPTMNCSQPSRRHLPSEPWRLWSSPCLPPEQKVWAFHRALVAQSNCRIHSSYVGPALFVKGMQCHFVLTLLIRENWPALTERLTLSIKSLAPGGNPTSKTSRSVQTRLPAGARKKREQQKTDNRYQNPTFHTFLSQTSNSPGRRFTHGLYNYVVLYYIYFILFIYPIHRPESAWFFCKL